jgi:Cytosol aminopeptidase family, N-terminal domain
MKIINRILCIVLVLVMSMRAEAQDVKEKAFDAPNNVKIKVRMEGPYTADVPLQIVCYFKYTPDGAKRMKGAPVELDKKLGGVIASLRERGEFVGDELETLWITPPKGAIKAKALLLVGLGKEEALSLKVMERVGRVSLREAAKAGVKRVAFAPLIRDQGNSKLPTGDVEIAFWPTTPRSDSRKGASPNPIRSTSGSWKQAPIFSTKRRRLRQRRSNKRLPR